MAAANFLGYVPEWTGSRDFLEWTSDRIDFETVVETTAAEEDSKGILLDVEKTRKEYLRKNKNRCIWLKIDTKQTCGKRCENYLCDNHTKRLKTFGKIPLPCLCCGVGNLRFNQLCKPCEIKYEVEYK